MRAQLLIKLGNPYAHIFELLSILPMSPSSAKDGQTANIDAIRIRKSGTTKRSKKLPGDGGEVPTSLVQGRSN